MTCGVLQYHILGIYQIVERLSGTPRMKDKLQQIIDSYNPKIVLRMIKKNSDLVEWIIKNSPNNTVPLNQQIYDIVHGQETCIYGNAKKFESLTTGYRGCGPARNCHCVRESVSQNVKKSKQDISQEQKDKSNKKREQTNLKKWGVKNSGQTPQAKKKHSEFYDDKNKVANVIDKIQQTNIQKRGVTHHMKSPEVAKQVSDTYKKRYNNPEYWSERFDNPSFHILHNKSDMEKLLLHNNPIQIAQHLDVHVQTVYRHLNIHGLRDPWKGLEETEFFNTITKYYSGKIIRNTRSLLPSGREIDIYIPDLNLAFEYNGIYWHHEDVPHITQNYHYEKFSECNSNGINLITVFSSEWKSRRSIIEHMIANKLGVATRIYARKCNIVELQNKQTKDFINKNHVKGYAPASVCYGLEYNDDIVAVMSFAKPRMGIGKKHENTYEMVRFCSSVGVTGGASKLVNYFEKQHPNTQIVSYSDNEWGYGNVYNTIGFEKLCDVKPGYWYVKPREEKMYHRLNYTKSKLVNMGYDPDMTEKQITQSMGLLRVWDCGKIKWIKKGTP